VARGGFGQDRCVIPADLLIAAVVIAVPVLVVVLAVMSRKSRR
jgi:hypothetical protein